MRYKVYPQISQRTQIKKDKRLFISSESPPLHDLAILDKYSATISSNKNLQKEVVNQILHWIDEGLDDWCISRDGPYFGFKIPGSKNKYYYVWLDAPIGYISSLTNYFKGNLKKAETYWNDSRIIHIIGKDQK